MQTYLVGGAVRDSLLGKASKDHDYVVVGARPEDLLAKGFRQVGADFPVFLHPATGEEYALARTERKTGPGYHGFACYSAPDVTLQDDLGRRDLTINAMARDADGALVDPFGGQRDLDAKLLRHVSDAFAEDPVRILRVARFSARYTEFTVAPETMALMQRMVAAGDVDQLVPERIWSELSRGLMEAKPSRMIEVLRGCGALARLLPEVDRLFGVPQPIAHHPEVDAGLHTLMVLDRAAHRSLALETRLAALLHDVGKGVTPADQWPRHHDHDQLGVPLVEAICRRWRAPKDCRTVAVLVAKLHIRIHTALKLRPGTVVSILAEMDAFRRPERLPLVLEACRCDAEGRLGLSDRAYPQYDFMQRALAVARQVDCGAIAQAVRNAAFIPEQIHGARAKAVAALYAEF